MMRKLAPIVFAAALTLPAIAFAGFKAGTGVTITATQFYGAIPTARNSADGTQSISCTIMATASSQTGFCNATNSAGTTAACTTSNAFLIDAIAASRPRV